MAAYLLNPAVSSAPSSIPDYSSSYNSIQSELNDIDIDTTTIAATILGIAASLATIAGNSTTIAEKTTQMEAHQNRIKELGETVGYRIKSPYEVFMLVSIYKVLVKEAKVLDLEDSTDEERAQALQRVIDYMNEIETVIPTEF